MATDNFSEPGYHRYIFLIMPPIFGGVFGHFGPGGLFFKKDRWMISDQLSHK